MNRDEIITMARQAGLEQWVGPAYMDYVERFAELVAAKAAAAEREQCAQACDQRAALYMPVNRDAVGKASQIEARLCADAIRARGAAPQPAGDTGVQP